MSLEFREVVGAGDINLGVISIQIAFKALKLDVSAQGVSVH